MGLDFILRVVVRDDVAGFFKGAEMKQRLIAMGCSAKLADKFAAPLNAAMERYSINTPARMAAFVAQIMHESGRLVFVREIWNPKQCAWQARYEGRTDLGNIRAGDGERFKGRGLIQITGRANYRTCGTALGEDFEAAPERLELPALAAMSAAWFWRAHDCNELADAGNFERITKRINGGLNGQADRLALWAIAKEVFKHEAH
jgi:putative chitinase